jgi:hypothetical protein
MSLQDRLAEARAKELLKESRTAATDGSALIDKSIALREEALRILPPGVILEFVFPARMPGEYRVIRQDDGRWTHDGKTVDDEWVSEEWMRANLRIHEPS